MAVAGRILLSSSDTTRTHGLLVGGCDGRVELGGGPKPNRAVRVFHTTCSFRSWRALTPESESSHLCPGLLQYQCTTSYKMTISAKVRHGHAQLLSRDCRKSGVPRFRIALSKHHSFSTVSTFCRRQGPDWSWTARKVTVVPKDG